MYHERKIRFLYPPFIFIISVLLGLYFDCNRKITDIIPFLKNPSEIYELILVIIGGSVFILVLGFIIEVLTMNIIHFCSLIFRKKSYTAADSLEEASYINISKLLLRENQIANKQQNFFAALTFEGAIVPKETQEWLVRRWTSFNVSSSSTFAIITSIIPILMFDIRISFWWILINIIIGFFLVINAINSWKLVKGMIDFLSYCDYEKIKKYKSD